MYMYVYASPAPVYMIYIYMCVSRKTDIKYDVSLFRYVTTCILSAIQVQKQISQYCIISDKLYYHYTSRICNVIHFISDSTSPHQVTGK